MKKISIFLIIITIIIISLYATNPTKSEFKEYAEDSIVNMIENSGVTSNSFIDNFLTLITGKAISSLGDITYTRDNYYLFGIYDIKGIDIDYKFIGVFRQFIPINSSLDKNNINKKFKDEVSLINNEKLLDEDYYECYEINLVNPSEVYLDIEYISGPKLEMYVFDEDGFSKWKDYMDGNRNIAMSHFSDWYTLIDRNINKSGNLNSGKYYFVFDNTDIGDVSPPFNFVNDQCRYKVSIKRKDL